MIKEFVRPSHPILKEVTERIIVRSQHTRSIYLQRLKHAAGQRVTRAGLSCTNLAHAVAAMPADDKFRLKTIEAPNLAIVSSYNDMLSAHQPLQDFPAWIKQAASEVGATAQFAGGVPAMCDGVTQGQAGMELSLFSRDVIALSTAIALSHQMFDAALYLGVCDKIIPGLVMGALSFGHLPAVFVPAGPMTTGLGNAEKAAIREKYTAGQISREALLEAECQAYHGAGTCTFYGTANSNQMLMEIMGLHLPGSAFVNPHTPLREALTRQAARHAVSLCYGGSHYTPIGEILDERAFVNGIVGLLTTGGSTNHTLHLIAMARVAGITLNWDDFDRLSDIVPLLARVYPNGSADVNQFQAAGGLPVIIHSLLAAGLLHEDVQTIVGQGLHRYTQEPMLLEGKLTWRDGPTVTLENSIVTTTQHPFSPDGGLKLLKGNLGRAVIKTSAVAPQHRVIEAPAIVFYQQDDLIAAFTRGELERDFVAVLPYQGPAANGMPELHKLTPTLSILLKRGFKVALITDGRMSGASGKVPAAIHITPEALNGGKLGQIQDHQIIRIDSINGILEVLNEPLEKSSNKDIPGIAHQIIQNHHHGVGRELFSGFRQNVSPAEQGACALFSLSEM